jgi:hypothetical protein
MRAWLGQGHQTRDWPTCPGYDDLLSGSSREGNEFDIN